MLKKWNYENYTLADVYRSIEPGAQKINYRRVNVTNGRANIALGHILFEIKSEPRSTLKREVDYASYAPFRRKLVVGLIETASFKNYTFESLRGAVKDLRTFLRFSLNVSVLNEDTLLDHLDLYVDHLREQIRLYNKNRSKGCAAATARAAQRILIDITENVLGDGTCSHIRPIKINRHQTVNTEAPAEVELAQHLTHYTVLFEQLADRLINVRKFPWELSMYGKSYFVFPYRGKLTSLDSENGKYFDNPGFNYETGKLNTKEEIYESLTCYFDLEDHKIWEKVYHHHRSSRERLDEANASALEKRRRFFATLAMRSYLSHFMIVTGINDAVAATLQFSSVEILPGKRKFKNLKLRAGGREVVFEIQKIFIKYFKKFLKLREFILNETGETSSTLFFELPLRSKMIVVKSLRDDGHAVQGTAVLDPFNSFLPNITTREYRVAKGQWVSEKKGIEAASFSMQHSKQTNVRSYNEASQEKTDREVTSYFDEFNGAVLKSTKRKRRMETDAGGCTKPNQPSASGEFKEAFAPNCETQEGCLFCDKYVVHPDEKDIRKLFSMSFLIRQYEAITDIESFNSVFAALLGRITEILNEIKLSSKRANSLVESVKVDVFENENLSEYWACKYEMLDELGVI